MYVTRRFEYSIDTEFGNAGWIPQGMKGFNASNGLGVAHDSLEHFSATDTTMEAEIMAFGAMLYIRADNYNFGPHGMHVSLSSDLTLFLIHHQKPLIAPPANKPLRYHEEELDMVLEQVRKDWEGEGGEAGKLDASIEYIRGWAREGYRKAYKRFKSAETHRVCGLFNDIQETVDSLSENREIGDIMTVSFSPTTFDYSVKVKELYA